MGYEFHITRAADWADSESSPILLDEWKAYVSSDPEFRLDGFAQSNAPRGSAFRYENEGLAVWTAYSRHVENECMAWFDFRRGRIVVKNADDEVRKKMKRIANALRAKVLGDEGEEY